MIATSWVPSDFQRGGTLASRVPVHQTIAIIGRMSKQRTVPKEGSPVTSPDIHAAVLAGGKSRRYGSDKCIARLDGNNLTFIQLVIRACREVADRVVIVGHVRPGSTDDADD